MRANTVLAGSKLKLERFVMLLWNFTERGKSYQQISNAANLPPQAHYVEDKLSPNSIANFIIILLSHFHFCHIKICFRYRNNQMVYYIFAGGGTPFPKTFVQLPSHFWHAKFILRC